MIVDFISRGSSFLVLVKIRDVHAAEAAVAAGDDDLAEECVGGDG